MRYRPLGRTALQVSELCLGTMNFGPMTSEADSFNVLDQALEYGINFVDTANQYGGDCGVGTTESIVGRWLARGDERREQVVLATKLYEPMSDRPNDRGLSARHIRTACDASLRRLQTDHIDLYQMHHLDRAAPWDEVWQAMETLVSQGKITYVDRIVAAPFHEHLDNIATRTAAAHARGDHLAVTTTTNDHVDAINSAVQAHRLTAGQLGTDHLELGDTSLHIGDVITTRHNQRHLRTTTGDSVRNRDYWTINHISPDGDLAVTRIDGHGDVTLPHSYAAEHVQLGYAATEPGNQSGTASASITLATPATTCRGLYVAVTRGRTENLICVVTDTHDTADAIDILEHILATDRADHPATRIRQELAATTPQTPALRPRCEIPDWFTDLHHQARQELAVARTAHAAEHARDRELPERIDQLGRQLSDLEPRCAPHDHAIARATTDLHHTEQQHRQAENALANTGRLRRRGARNAVDEAAGDVATARTALDELTRRAQPLLDQRAELRHERDQLRREHRNDQQLSRSLHRLGTAHQQLDALDTWHAWATGHTPPPAKLINAAHQLHHTSRHHRALAEPLTAWIHQHDLAPRQPAPSVQQTVHHQPRLEPPGLDIGL